MSLASALTYFSLVRAILRANHHDEKLVRALGRDVKGIISPLVGIAVAPLNPYLSYAYYIFLSLMWFVPDRRLVREHRH